MKKHENAVKALMKNVKDNEKWYGYFEDENGARYLMNMHIVIKLTGSTLDYVGELPRLDNIKLVKQFIDFIGTFKKGEYSATVNVDDVKIFDKYKKLGECFKQQYADNKYIAFNPFYFCKLNILTGSDLLTITDNKSPIYIAGNDIECVFLPCSLDKNYNFDNYAVFLEELKACYIQDAKTKEENEKQKALKNTYKIEKDVIYNGFTMWIGGKQYFLMSNKKRVTDEITKDFLKLIAANTTINVDKISESDFKYIKNGINSATITKTASYYGNEEIYRIETKYNSENFYKNEYDRLIIYNGNMEKVNILADDMSATDEETPKTATIQDNAADIVADPETSETKTADNMSVNNTDTANNDSVTATQDIKTSETMQADAKQTDTTQDTTPTQDKPHKTSNKSVSLFIVTDKPQPVKLYGANIPTLERIPTYTQRIISRFKPPKNNKGYNTRVKELKPLKKAYNDFVSTVSMSCDKCAIGGDMVAVNSS